MSNFVVMNTTSDTNTQKITARTISMGAVSLYVRDITVMKRFYHEVILLDIISASDGVVILGHGKTRLVELHSQEDAARTLPNDAGLYHLAILYTSRSELAKTLVHIFSHWQRYFVGSADHLVSEAFYFTDPEGNGIELYIDKDPDLWKWENGSVKMASIYIDPASYIQIHQEPTATKHNRMMGHVHLRVGDIEVAKKLYVEILGFTVTATLPGALFISRDEYHHHIGMNIWESQGAEKRNKSSGIKSFEIHIHSKEEFESIKRNLIRHAVEYSEIDGGLSLRDPWNTRIEILLRDK